MLETRKQTQIILKPGEKKEIVYGVNLGGNFLLLQRQINFPCKLCKEVNTCLLVKYSTDKQLLSGFSLICAGFHFLGVK